MNVANVLPGDTIPVELRYTELLVPDRRRLRVRLSDRCRTALLRKARKPRHRRADEFVQTPYTHQGEAPPQRVPPRGRGLDRHADSGARVAVASARVPLERARDARSRARRLRAVLGQSRLHPSLSAGRPDRLARAPALPGERRELLPADGGAAAGGRAPRRSRRASTSSWSTCRDR